MKYTKIIFAIFFTLTILFGCSGSVYAKKTLGDADTSLGQAVAPTGISESNINNYLANVVSALLAAVGLAFFILMVYAGVRWFTSRGEEEYVTKARKTLIGSVIGIVIVASAYAMTTFVTNRISGEVENELISNSADTTPVGEGQVCCIVPATKNIGSPYTASIRDPQQCWDFAVEAYPSSEGDAITKKANEEKGDGWEMYEEINDLGKCMLIFECWDGGPYSDAAFNECIAEANE